MEKQYNKVCAIQGTDDENTEGMRIIASSTAIFRWLRNEQELTIENVYHQSMEIIKTIVCSSYELTDKQAKEAIKAGDEYSKVLFKKEDYRGFVKLLGVAGACNELTPKGLGDLTMALGCFYLLIEKHESDEIKKKYLEDISITCEAQLDSGLLFDSLEIIERALPQLTKRLRLQELYPIN